MERLGRCELLVASFFRPNGHASVQVRMAIHGEPRPSGAEDAPLIEQMMEMSFV